MIHPVGLTVFLPMQLHIFVNLKANNTLQGVVAVAGCANLHCKLIMVK